MRLDYILYILAALLFLITAVSSIMLVETERNLWVVTTVVLGILSIGLGYSQRPKTKAQACQPAVATPQATMPEPQPATTIETPAITEALELTQVKGIGEKRATQLKAVGINSVNDLAEASAEDIAKKLQISSKITKKWIDSAKALVK
jgi:predicted flap endonuclease-1-like 5' DNA nuclease